MFNIRTIITFVLLTATFLLCFDYSLALPAEEEENQQYDLEKDELFEVYANYYFFKQEVEFSSRMALQEWFLLWLFEGINAEVEQRRREDLSGTLTTLNIPHSELFTEYKFNLPEGFQNLDRYRQYLTLESLQQREYNYKYAYARILKDRLIASGAPNQIKRMFNHDLAGFQQNYVRGSYDQAVLQINEVIEQYGYINIYDLHFYRGETYFAMQLYGLALESYLAALDFVSDKEIERKAIQRILVIYGNKGDITNLNEYWERYKIASIDDIDQDYYWTAHIAGRYNMLANNFGPAKELFETIPPDAACFVKSQLFLAECLLALFRMDDADFLFLKLTGNSIEGQEIDNETAERAQLKVGYINYLRGNYDISFYVFTRIQKGKYLEEADIGAAWSLYRMGELDESARIAREFLEEYPNSEYSIEARALLGFCNEMTDQDSAANFNYDKILYSVDESAEYRNIIIERRQINELVKKIKIMERQVFEEGKRWLFPDYLDLKNELTSLSKKIELFEGYKSHPELKKAMEEKARLSNIMKQQADLEESIYEAGDAKLLEDFDENMTNLIDLADRLDAGIRNKMKEHTIVQREQKQNFKLSVNDSLRVHYQRERESIRESIQQVNDIIDRTDYAQNPDLYVSLKSIDVELRRLHRELIRSERDNIRFEGKIVDSQLDMWSDFANSRNIYAGLNFEDYYGRNDDIESLDLIIQRLNQVRAYRNRETPEPIQLPDELMLASAKGGEPYHAPLLPLWDTHSFMKYRGGFEEQKPATIEEERAVEESIDTSRDVFNERNEEQQERDIEKNRLVPATDKNREEPSE